MQGINRSSMIGQGSRHHASPAAPHCNHNLHRPQARLACRSQNLDVVSATIIVEPNQPVVTDDSAGTLRSSQLNGTQPVVVTAVAVVSGNDQPASDEEQAAPATPQTQPGHTQPDQPHHKSARVAPFLPGGSFPHKRDLPPARERSFMPPFEPQYIMDMFGVPSRSPPAPAAPYIQGLQTLAAETGGEVLVYQLHRDAGAPDPTTLPLMLYLPGIDGTGLAAYRQFPTLHEHFDLRAAFIPTENRSSFDEIVEAVKSQLEAELVGGDPLRPVYLLGESFGGLVALALAQRTDTVDRIVLCNPATSFDDSVWPQAGPLLTTLPPTLYNALPIALSPILTNPINVALHALPDRPPGSLPPSPLDLASAAAWGLIGMLPELGSLRAVLPPATLAHRLKLLQEGSIAVNDTLGRVQQRVLLVVGENDLVIPSATEGPRLQKALSRCTLKVLKGRSHAMLQEAGLDLSSILDEEGFYVKQRVLSCPPEKRELPKSGATFGKAAPCELPTPQEIQRALDDGGLSLLRKLVSPVFFSTDPATGRLVQGLEHVPLGRPGRPVLLVGNHQTFAPDLPLMIAAFLQDRGVLVRGLAHPVALGGMSTPVAAEPPEPPRTGPRLPWESPRRKTRDSSGSNPFGSFLKTFGGVTVSGANMHKLFALGETALVFPGGVREAYKLRNEKYQLIWPNKPEFVRMAAKFGAVIVPFGAIGAEDGINQVLDTNELQSLPVVGPWLREQAEKAPQARQGATISETNIDNFTPPLVTFNPPARFYYAFGKPIETTPEMAKDRVEGERIYREVRNSCASNIDYLLTARDKDPYGDLFKRLLYEASWGGRKQAPTFTP